MVTLTQCTQCGTVCSKHVDVTFTGGLAKQTAFSACFCSWTKLPSLLQILTAFSLLRRLLLHLIHWT